MTSGVTILRSLSDSLARNSAVTDCCTCSTNLVAVAA